MSANPFTDTNTGLDDISARLCMALDELSALREAYQTAEAAYENDMARYTLEEKARNPKATQTDIKAQATCLAHPSRMTMIRAESSYRKVQNEIKALEGRLEALREKSFNLRKEFSR